MRIPLRDKHVLVTGGSTGIGFHIAKCMVLEGADVTILARNVTKLEEAQKELAQLSEEKKTGSKVCFQSADVTNSSQLQAALKKAEEAQGPVDVLVCNAGAAAPGYFHELELEVFESTMRLNYMGTVNAIKALINGMVKRGSGHICIVSSAMGTMGFIGYTTYAPTKYALRGLADCLRNEMQGTGVSVSISFPPDTDTPGFATENLNKPAETKKISEDSSVFPAETVASCLVKGIKKGYYILPTPDLGLAVHNRSIQGMVPRSFPGVLLDMLVGFISPVLHMVYASIWDKISREGAKQRYSKLLAEPAE